MKISKTVIVGLSAAFLLAGCKGDNGNRGPDNGIDEARMLRKTFEVTTKDNRRLAVSATGYCEKLEDLPMGEYKAQCSAYIQKELDYFARDRDCFEAAIPAVSPAVRNHPGLPQGREFCYDHYPDDYASWTEPMMKRALELTPVKDNLYTVTAIKPL